MGAKLSDTKYLIIFGDKESGKTLMQYQLQSSIKLDSTKIKPTYGFNYEEVSLTDFTLGIFDASGDLSQYGIIDIITKCINIEGIIFMVALDKLQELDKAKQLLKTILSNNFLKENISLMVIYNKKGFGDRLDWIKEDLLDSRLNLDKLKERYKLACVQSKTLDVYDCSKTELKDELEKFVFGMSFK